MSGRVRVEQSSGSIFTDLGFPKAEAESLMLRSQLMFEVREMARGMTQAKAAKCFGITQPLPNNLLRGRIDASSLEALVKMIAFAGLRVQLRLEHLSATQKLRSEVRGPTLGPGPAPSPAAGHERGNTQLSGGRRLQCRPGRIGVARNHWLKRCFYATAILGQMGYFWRIGELCSASYLVLVARGHDISDGLEAAMGKPANSDDIRGTPVTTAAAVADYLLWASRERGEPLSNLKLQKLLYYAQAWYLALNDQPLFADDFQAWVHGPVLPSQYRRFKAAAWMPIAEPVDEPALPEAVKAFLNEILDVFGVETAIALELMTHRERPWAEARGGLPPDASSNKIISKRSMRDFYRAMRAE